MNSSLSRNDVWSEGSVGEMKSFLGRAMPLLGVLAVLTSIGGCEGGQVIIAQGPTRVLEKPIPEERFKVPRQEGDASMGEPKLVATLDSGMKVRLLKIEYFKDYAAYKVELPDGRRGYVFHGDNIQIIDPEKPDSRPRSGKSARK